MDKPPKRLIWFTLIFLVIIATVSFYVGEPELPEQSVSINWKGHPTLGYSKAKVHVVLFEEPKCTNCKDYNNEIYPKIKKEFIDTNKITYTVIPVSFLPGSMPAAVALLCVYYADPLYPNSELFFTYFDYIYEHQPDEHTDWATPEKLIEVAQHASPAIDTTKLRKCIDMETYRIKIQKNNDYAKEVMGGTISTPNLYVNGIEVKELSYEHISKLIRDVMQHEGVY